MYAVVRINELGPDRERAAQHQLREFEEAHAAQPGYRGTLTVDLDGHRRLLVNLWESEEHAVAARAALSAAVGRLLSPVLTRPSTLLGAGVVLTQPPEALG